MSSKLIDTADKLRPFAEKGCEIYAIANQMPIGVQVCQAGGLAAKELIRKVRENDEAKQPAGVLGR